jgi:hypothetical protein
VNCLRAILEYAVVADDPRLKDFVRDGYEWTRHVGFARIGYVGDNQGCGCARLIGLAVKLSDAGLGDYWEDVDQYIRNLGTEQQFTPDDLPFMCKLAERQTIPAENQEGFSYDNVPERIVGAFAGRTTKTVHWLCCGTHGNMGLYYAWDGTLRYQDGVARVNLLLNRASPWVQVDSYLPYEGKVVLKNRAAHTVLVRIPAWADLTKVSYRLNGKPVTPEIEGRYARVESLEPGDEVSLEFPMKDWTAEYNVPFLGGANNDWAVPGDKLLTDMPPRARHRCRFLGNTLVEIDPPLMPGEPVFKHSDYLSGKAPLKDTTYFVTPTVLKW